MILSSSHDATEILTLPASAGLQIRLSDLDAHSDEVETTPVVVVSSQFIVTLPEGFQGLLTTIDAQLYQSSRHRVQIRSLQQSMVPNITQHCMRWNHSQYTHNVRRDIVSGSILAKTELTLST